MPVLKLTHTLASKPEVNSIWANIRYTLFGGDDGLSPSRLQITIATNTQEGVHVCVQKKSSHPGWSQLRGDGEMLFLHANEKYSTTIHHPDRIKRKEGIHILDDQGILFGGDETTSLLVTEAWGPSIHTRSNLHHRRASASEAFTPSGIPIDPVPPSDAELPTAAIAGGVVVGVLGIVALCSLGFVWRRRQKKRNQPRVDTHEGKPDETELGLVVSAFGDPTHVQFTSIEERLEKGKGNGSPVEADNTGGALEGHSANGVAEEVNLGVVKTDEINVTPSPADEAKPEVSEFEIQSVRD